MKKIDNTISKQEFKRFFVENKKTQFVPNVNKAFQEEYKELIKPSLATYYLNQYPAKMNQAHRMHLFQEVAEELATPIILANRK